MNGLLDRDIEMIHEALSRLPEIEYAVLFGSRAMGNFKTGSDVDLAIVGKTVTNKTLSQLNTWLNETYPLPYMFDLLHYERISHKKLKEHIDTVGKVLYRKQKRPSTANEWPS